MNISNFIQRLAGNYETRSTTNDTNAIKAPLKAVKIGDELKVQVLHIGEDTAIVKLEDGSEISIAGNLPEDAAEGTWLNILITDKGEGVPAKAEILGTIKLAEDLNKQITSILKDLNIPNTKVVMNLTPFDEKKLLDFLASRIWFCIDIAWPSKERLFYGEAIRKMEAV